VAPNGAKFLFDLLLNVPARRIRRLLWNPNKMIVFIENHALGLATWETRVIETMRWDWLHGRPVL